MSANEIMATDEDVSRVRRECKRRTDAAREMLEELKRKDWPRGLSFGVDRHERSFVQLSDPTLRLYLSEGYGLELRKECDDSSFTEAVVNPMFIGRNSTFLVGCQEFDPTIHRHSRFREFRTLVGDKPRLVNDIAKGFDGHALFVSSYAREPLSDEALCFMRSFIEGGGTLFCHINACLPGDESTYTMKTREAAALLSLFGEGKVQTDIVTDMQTEERTVITLPLEGKALDASRLLPSSEKTTWTTKHDQNRCPIAWPGDVDKVHILCGTAKDVRLAHVPRGVLGKGQAFIFSELHGLDNDCLFANKPLVQAMLNTAKQGTTILQSSSIPEGVQVLAKGSAKFSSLVELEAEIRHIETLIASGMLTSERVEFNRHGFCGGTGPLTG